MQWYAAMKDMKMSAAMKEAGVKDKLVHFKDEVEMATMVRSAPVSLPDMSTFTFLDKVALAAVEKAVSMVAFVQASLWQLDCTPVVKGI